MSASEMAKKNIHGGEELICVLQTSEIPSEVNAALLMLLQPKQQPHENLGFPLEYLVPISPALLFQLLRLLVERTSDAWLEVRKKIAFLFSDLQSRVKSDMLADVLLHGKTYTAARSEAYGSNTDDTGEVDGISAAAVREMKKILAKLADAHSTIERCVPTVDVFRTLMRVPSFLEMILSPTELLTGTDEDKKPRSYPQVKRHQFERSCIGILSRGVSLDTAVLCTETWRSLMGAICTNKNLSASLLLYYYNEFVSIFVSCLRGRNFVAKFHALELLAAILEDAAFLKARPKFAESPAVLCALLSLTNSSSSHIRFLIFDSIKVFIAKGSKPAPIRYILYVNREMLARYVEEYSTDESAINHLLNTEKQKLLQSLIFLEPLSHEEELLLGVS